ncbi:TPA: hypothetical protein QDB40_003523 [Burkholderia vietnamiensis]|nr:hypothetical protein [Burkholderia vietnamiensis]
MANITPTQPDLLSIYEKSSAIATFPSAPIALGGWSAKAAQIDVTGYARIYNEQPPHDPANLMFVMVTYGQDSDEPFTVSEITEAQFDRFAAIDHDPRSYDADDIAAIRAAMHLAESIAPNVIRHQAEGKKEKVGGYRFG